MTIGSPTNVRLELISGTSNTNGSKVGTSLRSRKRMTTSVSENKREGVRPIMSTVRFGASVILNLTKKILLSPS